MNFFRLQLPTIVLKYKLGVLITTLIDELVVAFGDTFSRNWPRVASAFSSYGVIDDAAIKRIFPRS